jgi:hypothetical protein
MQQFLERKTVVTDLIQKYVCKSHAAIPGKENTSNRFNSEVCMYENPMQQFLERKTVASNRFNSEVCMYVNPMQRFLERKTVASNRFNSEVCMYINPMQGIP